MNVILEPECLERCRNVPLIEDYAAKRSDAEAGWRAHNQDLIVKAGQIACKGCLEGGRGENVLCGAKLTDPRFAIRGEPVPKPADDDQRPIHEAIEGFRMIIDHGTGFIEQREPHEL